MLKEKLIIGLGVTGLSCADFYHKKNIPFKIFDTRSKSFPTKKNNDTRYYISLIVAFFYICLTIGVMKYRF